MAKKKRHGSKGGKAIPVLPVAAALMPAFKVFNQKPDVKAIPWMLVFEYTGFDPNVGKWTRSDKAYANLGMIIAATIGHKIANRTVNKYVRKATFGYLAL